MKDGRRIQSPFFNFFQHQLNMTSDFHKCLTKKDYVVVGKDRPNLKEPFKIYYELHGSGPTKIVFMYVSKFGRGHQNGGHN
jgi:hypothetical protein